MPTFEIEQYEVHTQKYHIEAATQAEAIRRLLEDDDIEPLEGSTEYVETDEERGLSTAREYHNLAAKLEDMGIGCGAVIPSIASIKEL